MFETLFAWFKEYGMLVLGAIKKYGKKAVFAIFMLGVMIFSIEYIIDKKINKIVPQSIESSIEKNAEIQETAHTEKLVKSQEIYSDIKGALRQMMHEVGCEYVYLIEYHNGSTNIATAFPFRKFDVTMDICKDGVPYINTTTLKDEHVTKYDIFDNPEFTKQQFAYCDRKTFEKVDVKLYHMMSNNKDIKWVYTYNLYYNNNLLGAILVLSYKEIDIKKFINYMHELENIFNK